MNGDDVRQIETRSSANTPDWGAACHERLVMILGDIGDIGRNVNMSLTVLAKLLHSVNLLLQRERDREEKLQ